MTYPTQPPTWTPQPTYCDACGKRSEPGGKFCAGCGAELPPEPPQPASPPPYYAPPAVAIKVDDTAAWFLAFSLVIGAICVATIGTTSGWLGFLIYFVVNTILSRWDMHNLEKAGIKPPSLGLGVTLVPVYLWQRQHKLGKTYAPFVICLIVWIASFSVLGSVLSSLGVSTSTINGPKVAAGIQNQANPDFPIASVSCPNNVKVIAGNTFDCTAIMGDSTTQNILVTITNNQGYVHWVKPIG